MDSHTLPKFFFFFFEIMGTKLCKNYNSVSQCINVSLKEAIRNINLCLRDPQKYKNCTYMQWLFISVHSFITILSFIAVRESNKLAFAISVNSDIWKLHLFIKCESLLWAEWKNSVLLSNYFLQLVYIFGVMILQPAIHLGTKALYTNFNQATYVCLCLCECVSVYQVGVKPCVAKMVHIHTHIFVHILS